MPRPGVSKTQPNVFMIDQQSYITPRQEHSFEFEEKKSRFICALYPTDCRDDALKTINRVSRENARANHNCYGFIIGNPAKPAEMAASDDGEPSGTAGRPILNVMQQQAVGDAVVIVTRYFGGIKLGAGGLVRAYSRGAKDVLAIAEFREVKPVTTLDLQFDFAFEALVRATASNMHGTSTGWKYGDCVSCIVNIPCDTAQMFIRHLQDRTAGGIKFRHR